MNEPMPCPCGQTPEPLKLPCVQHISCDNEKCAGTDFAAEGPTLEEAIRIWNLWCEDVRHYVTAERERIRRALQNAPSFETRIVGRCGVAGPVRVLKVSSALAAIRNDTEKVDHEREDGE